MTPVYRRLRTLIAIPLFIPLASDAQPAGSTVKESLTDAEAVAAAEAIERRTPISTIDGLDASLWATERFLIDPVGIDVDDQGRAWVSVTRRRRSSMFDIRGFPQWVQASWSWKRVDERVAFLRKMLSPENSEQNTWLADFNNDGSHDWRDLMVEEEEIYQLEDTSGDGRADTLKRHALFRSGEQTDIAGTVLYHDGSVYLGLPPDVWRLQDLDEDGEFETKTSISSGYAIHIGFGGHGLSGLKVGPDGRLYWGIGDIGFTGTDLDGDYHEYPRQGVLVRCEPDGTGFEVYAHGLRNVHEFDWDQYGNLIGVDNDGDHAGEEERIVYLIDGSDTGWRNNWQLGKYTDPKNNRYKVWMDEAYYKPRFPGQAAHILPTIDNYHTGPAGLVYQPGTALNGRFKNHFFVASFTGNAANSSIYAYALKPKGASFELASDQKIMSGVTAVGIDFGPDGALYLADWAEGWDTDGVGRIWKLYTSAPQNDESRKTETLLNSSFAEAPRSTLLTLLNHPDRRVRLNAQFELVKREEERALRMALSFPDDQQLARIHALWGLGQLCRYGKASPNVFRRYANHPDPEIKAQIAKIWGDLRFEGARKKLQSWTQSENLRIQFLATEALGRIGDASAFDSIVAMLQANDDRDAYLRAAGAIALARIDSGSRLAKLSEHPSKAVRIAAIVALKRLEHPGAAAFLSDADEYVATDAARAINDDAFIEKALPKLAETLTQTSIRNDPFLRRSINANLYSGRPEDAKRLIAFAESELNPLAMRIESVNTLSTWSEPSPYDRVTGILRPDPENDVQDAREALSPHVDSLLSGQDEALRLAVIEAIGDLTLATAEETLLALISNDAHSSKEKSAALKSLSRMKSPLLVSAVETMLTKPDSEIRATALALVPNLTAGANDKATLLATAWDTATVPQKQTILATIATLRSEQAEDFLSTQLSRLNSGELAPSLELDLFQAIEAYDDASLDQRLDAYRTELAGKGTLASHRYALYGGDASSGREVVYNVPAAQCIRCHAINGKGGDVGPELANVGRELDRATLLESLVDPSARIAEGYGIVTVTTTEGKTFQGILQTEDSSEVAITTTDGQEVRIRKSDIANRIAAPSSMPPMGLLLTPSQLRDVVAYLASLKSDAPPPDPLSHGNN